MTEPTIWTARTKTELLAAGQRLEAELAREKAANLRRHVSAEVQVDNLLGYLDWCNGCIPANQPKESNVRAFAVKIRAALSGEGDRG